MNKHKKKTNNQLVKIKDHKIAQAVHRAYRSVRPVDVPPWEDLSMADKDAWHLAAAAALRAVDWEVRDAVRAATLEVFPKLTVREIARLIKRQPEKYAAAMARCEAERVKKAR